MKLTVATCQFPTSSDINSNFNFVSMCMNKAKEQCADAAHFPEACLSGYAGSDVESYQGFNWKLLHECTYELMNIAGKLKLWLILGTIHKLTEPNKPHNSLYIINNEGKLIDRYDKRFCSTGDLAHYSPGDHFCLFEINGVQCGTLICYDYRFPELYREYKRKGVQLIFHSYHAAHVSPEIIKQIEEHIGLKYLVYNRGNTYPSITMPASMIAAAASSHLWISCPNSSAKESHWGSFFVRADGVITGQLDRNSTDILVSTVDTDEKIYDSTFLWRGNALSEILHSGELVNDERSLVRDRL